MSLFILQGTVTGVGAATLLPGGALHDWIEITGDDGCIFNVSGVFVGADASRGLRPDVRGEFFFDKVFMLVSPARVWKQLYGIRIEGDQAIYDPVSLRAGAVISHIKIGLVLLITGFGVIWLSLAAAQWAKAILTFGARQRAFLGGWNTASDVRQREAVRI
ncbi:MAG: hypothetical protein K2Y27_16265 [Xanthobacteraceae bacterium]|nr:hypothetical protein [Xanthobacteraceae bacterium]